MSNLVIVIVCLFIGLGLQRVKRFPANAYVSLNAYVIYVALPAVVLNEIPKLVLDAKALLPVILAWVIMLLTAALVFASSRVFKWSREVTGALMLTVPLGNTSFVGFPLIEALLGSNALPYAILYDQFGTFLALNTAGIAVASFYAKQHEQQGSVWQKIIVFPPFIALVLALGLRWFTYPDWLGESIERIAATLVPVVMVAVGLQWRLRLDREHLGPFALAIIYLLFITPAIAWALTSLLGIKGLVAHVIILEAAMPAMISAGVLAMSHNLAPKLTAAIVGYSLTLALVSVWGWKLLIQA